MQWDKYFHEVKDEMCHSTIQRSEAELNGTLNGTFHLSPNENICSIARKRKHSLFASLAQAQHLYKPRVQLDVGSITRTLASR